MVRAAGEVDLSTVSILQAALIDGLGHRPSHLLVDIAELAFCDVRGMALLVEACPDAAGQGTGYAVCGASGHINRHLSRLWPAGELPIRYRTVAAGVIAAMALRTTRP